MFDAETLIHKTEFVAQALDGNMAISDLRVRIDALHLEFGAFMREFSVIRPNGWIVASEFALKIRLMAAVAHLMASSQTRLGGPSASVVRHTEKTPLADAIDAVVNPMVDMLNRQGLA